MSAKKTMLATLSALSVSLGISAEAVGQVTAAPSTQVEESASVTPAAIAEQAASTTPGAIDTTASAKSGATATAKPASAPKKRRTKKVVKAVKAPSIAPPSAQDVTVNKAKTSDKAHQTVDKFVKQ